jgi:hypothetical protein
LTWLITTLLQFNTQGSASQNCENLDSSPGTSTCEINVTGFDLMVPTSTLASSLSAEHDEMSWQDKFPSQQHSSRSTSQSVIPTANDCSLARLGQISLGSSFEQLFFSQFNDVFGCNDSTSDVCAWVHLLSDFTISQPHSTEKASMVVQWSIRGACMALYGSMTQNSTFQHDARRWYTKSLNLQHKILAASLSPIVNSQGRRITPKARSLESYLIPPLMMCYYEVVTRTSAGNAGDDDLTWTIHMEAAANILKLLGGPRALRESGSPVARELYRTIRLGVLYFSVGKEKSHFFSEEEWIMEALRASEKRPFDSLVDILIRLPEYLDRCRQTSSTTMPLQEEVHANNTAKSPLETQIYMEILERLDQWQQNGKFHLLSFSESLLRAPLAEHRILLESIPVKIISAYILTAMCFAGYVIAYKVLYTLSGPGCVKRSSHMEQQSQYANAILSIFFVVQSPTSSAHWIFPLRVVSSLALSSSQQALAMNCLRTLGKHAGVSSFETIF